MSYCRWSTVLHDGYESDLYIYDHIDGYISVNVADIRWAGIQYAPRVVPLVPGENTDEFVASYRARGKWCSEQRAAGKLKRVPIGLPHDGESSAFDTPEECVAFLEKLKALGYRMPESVLDVSIYERE